MSTLTPDAVKKYRTEKHISQKELAKRVGVASSTISRFESGEGNLSDETESKVLEYMTRTTKDKSTIPVTPLDTPSENIVDNSLIVTTANQVIEKLIDDWETTVEAHMKTVRIPASALFTEDHTLGEMEQILTEAKRGFVREVKTIVQDRLDRIKRSV